jgi:hypothetical protein
VNTRLSYAAMEWEAVWNDDVLREICRNDPVESFGSRAQVIPLFKKITLISFKKCVKTNVDMSMM